MSKVEIQLECARLRKEIRETDYSRMSDVEIYQYIYDRYSEVFGEDYIGIPYNWTMPDMTAWETLPSFEFGKVILEIVGDNCNLVNRERLGFANMSYAEAEKAVMQKYAGRTLTVRDMCNILNEMCSMGYHNGSRIPFFSYVYDYIRLNIGDNSDENKEKIGLFLDSPLCIADAVNGINLIGTLPDTPMYKQSITNYFATLVALIQYGLCTTDENMYNKIMDHLSKNATTTTIGG